MSEILSMDQAGRILIPETIRQQLHLEPGSRLVADVHGDRLELTQAPVEARIEKRGKRRVVVGWDGFDAAEAINAARDEQVTRLDEIVDSEP